MCESMASNGEEKHLQVNDTPVADEMERSRGQKERQRQASKDPDVSLESI